MILRSLPMTDFSPLDGGVSDRLAGDWVFGSTEALRVNMKSPDDLYTSPPTRSHEAAQPRYFFRIADGKTFNQNKAAHNFVPHRSHFVRA